jgi:hypothetical protein
VLSAGAVDTGVEIALHGLADRCVLDQEQLGQPRHVLVEGAVGREVLVRDTRLGWPHWEELLEVHRVVVNVEREVRPPPEPASLEHGPVPRRGAVKDPVLVHLDLVARDVDRPCELSVHKRDVIALEVVLRVGLPVA